MRVRSGNRFLGCGPVESLVYLLSQTRHNRSAANMQGTPAVVHYERAPRGEGDAPRDDAPRGEGDAPRDDAPWEVGPREEAPGDALRDEAPWEVPEVVPAPREVGFGNALRERAPRGGGENPRDDPRNGPRNGAMVVDPLLFASALWGLIELLVSPLTKFVHKRSVNYRLPPYGVWALLTLLCLGAVYVCVTLPTSTFLFMVFVLHLGVTVAVTLEQLLISMCLVMFIACLYAWSIDAQQHARPQLL
ncbi:hypothetical protein BASA81_001112 [Batrachochytrium salamandrivorans]|nr:hypothetical protein BASA81_001112 [Batrachochytrium salamandrivorans]